MANEDFLLRNIVKFDGTNFQPWKFQMKTLSGYNDLSGIVEGSETLPAEVTGVNEAARNAGACGVEEEGRKGTILHYHGV